VFEQVVNDDGTLRTLDPTLERGLGAAVHVPMAAVSSEASWQAKLAMLPVLQPLMMPFKAGIKVQPEDCPVASVGEECAVVASGEGCELVLPDAATETAK